MPHRIEWIIRPESNLDAEHCLHIKLDPREVKQGLVTPPHNLEISFPPGPAFTFFRTVWCNAPPGFPGLPDNWGHESDPVSRERWYRVSYYNVIAHMPQWDGQSTIELEVTTHQSGAWSGSAKSSEFTFNDVKILPPVDGEICVLAPKPTGWWARICERLVFHLNLGAAHIIIPTRIPLLNIADQPVTDEKACSVRCYFSSTRDVEFQTLRITYSRGLLYGWLTSKKAILVVFGFLAMAASVVYGVVQFVVWLNQVL